MSTIFFISLSFGGGGRSPAAPLGAPMVLLMPRQHIFNLLDLPASTTPNKVNKCQISPRTEYQKARSLVLRTFKARIESN